jgi:hypothetical protein
MSRRHLLVGLGALVLALAVALPPTAGRDDRQRNRRATGYGASVAASSPRPSCCIAPCPPAARRGCGAAHRS